MRGKGGEGAREGRGREESGGARPDYV